VIALGLVSAAATAACAVRALGFRSLPARLLAGYVLLVAQIVLVVEALSPFRAMTATNVLVGQAILLLLGLGALRRRPASRRTRSSLVAELRGDRIVCALLLVVAAALGYELALAVLTPPNNWDSMSYHLSRAAAWYQHHGVAYVDAHTQRENANPPNAEILALYTFVLARGDRFVAAWQWLAEAASLVGVFMVARRLRFGAVPSLLAALLFAAFAQTALQASTTQNDLITASLVLACVAFAASRERHSLPIAAAALGLAVGTKLTAIFALPALAVVLAVAVPRRDRRRFALLVVAGIALLGSFGYVLNVVHAGSPLGPSSATSAWRPASVLDPPKTAAGIVVSTVLDLRGAPSWAANEDFSYFGPLGVLLVAPIVVRTLRRWRSGAASPLEGTLALSLPLFVAVLALGYRYNAWIGRFMLVPGALVAPLAASIHHRRRYAASVVGVAIAALAGTLAFDAVKPSGFRTASSIWTASPAHAEAGQRPAMEPVLRAIRSCIPATAAVGYVLGEDDWDYPLYGPRLERTLVRLPLGAALAGAERAHVDWAIARSRLLGPMLPGWADVNFPASGLVLLARDRSLAACAASAA
jgi:dolichyl-phosphate-mannose-protein mannosyltransferase